MNRMCWMEWTCLQLWMYLPSQLMQPQDNLQHVQRVMARPLQVQMSLQRHRGNRSHTSQFPLIGNRQRLLVF